MDVTITGTGANSNIESQVDATYQAGRTSIRPLDHIVGGVLGGHYSAAFPTGAVAGRTAADVILGFRWASPAKVCVLQRITAAATITTAQAATVQEIDYDLIRLTNFTVNYTTGATKQTFGASSNKMRSTMAATDLVSYGDVYASTTGASTGQTGTLDSLPLAYACLPGVAPTATYAGNLGMTDIWKQDKEAGHPLVFGQGEGFAIRVGTTQGATVAVKSVFTVEWAEVTSY